MKVILAFSFLLSAIVVAAQDKTVKQLQSEVITSRKKEVVDTSKTTWRKGGKYNISLTQGSLSNWAAGGDDFSLSINSYLSLYLNYTKGRHSWSNMLESYFGYLNTTSSGSRKNDDRLDILSKYNYALSEHMNVSGLFSFRTQLFQGYTYKDEEKTFSSTFLSPAYILLSEGLDYHPYDFLSIFVSPITTRWIIVKDDSLAARGLYGVDSGRHATSQLGAFVTINAAKDLSETLSYKGRLDLFSNYKHHPQNIDVFMSNVLLLKVSNILTASWNLDFIYDDDVRLFGKHESSPALQVKSLVGLGLTLKF